MKKITFLKQSAAALIVAAVAFAGCKKDDPVNVTGVTLNKTALTLAVGDTATLAATVMPADAENKAVTWASDFTDVVTVNAAGKVTAVKAGTATITVTTKDGGKTASCVVTVIGVTLNKSALTLVVGTSETLVAAIAPDDAIDKTVEWTSSNEAVAIVDAAGKVTAVAPGEAVITVTTRDGGFTASCTVTVREPVPMTLTTAMEGKVTIYLAGTGTAVIDWGDGSTPVTVTLSAFKVSGYGSILFNDSHRYTHSFSGTSSRTIVIEGQKITHLRYSNLQLTALDVTKNTALTWLECAFNRLTSLDVSKNTKLTDLRCDSNQLTNLDLSENTALKRLWCDSNQLTSLNVSNNPALYDLWCDSNQLTNLDLSENTALTRLYCHDNRLTSLDVTKNTKLTDLICDGNQLSVDGLNALFGTLHSNPGTKNIYIYDNPGTGTCDRSIATGKGWTVH